MKKPNEIRCIVTDVVSIPVIRLASKTEAYRQTAKPGWGVSQWYSAADGCKTPVYRDRSDKTQQLACDEDRNPWDYDKELYKQRSQVERLFRHLKRFRRIFTRYDKLDIIFLSFVYFAFVVDALM